MNVDGEHYVIEDLTGGRRLSDAVLLGQAAYTERHLKYAYDTIVHVVANHLFWRCPTVRLAEHYNRNVSGDHLDVGVGTGILLARCRFPVPAPQIALMDLNPHALRSAARRIEPRHRAVALYRANILDPIPLERRFDSIGLMYVLHCLPGSLEEKGVALGHLKALLRPEGTLFGATILQDRFAETHLPARALSTWLRGKGIFANAHDTQDALERALGAHFANYALERIGGVALFSARA
jgi:SAM-dependent methyltransferase